MAYDPEKHLANRNNEEVTIYVDEDDIQLTIRRMPWSLKNQFASQAIQWDDEGRRSFHVDTYVRECLKYMVVQAPWGETSDTFLSQVGDELGTALQELVPTAFSGGNVATRADDVKKA